MISKKTHRVWNKKKKRKQKKHKSEQIQIQTTLVKTTPGHLSYSNQYTNSAHNSHIDTDNHITRIVKAHRNPRSEEGKGKKRKVYKKNPNPRRACCKRNIDNGTIRIRSGETYR